MWSLPECNEFSWMSRMIIWVIWWSLGEIIGCFNSIGKLRCLNLPFTFKTCSQMMGFSCGSLLLFGTGELLRICFISKENISDWINEIITLAESSDKSEFKIKGTLSLDFWRLTNNFIHAKWGTNFLHEENLFYSITGVVLLWFTPHSVSNSITKLAADRIKLFEFALCSCNDNLNMSGPFK